MRILLFLVTLCLGSMAAPAQWVRWETSEGGNGHWYRAVVSPTPISWHQASTNAAEKGYLATITSAAENAFVYSLVDSDPYWAGELGPALGGYHPAGSGEPGNGWSWVSGEPWSYSNWASGQPDNGDDPGEDGIIFLQGGGWNDKNTNQVSLISYVIESETDPSLNPSPTTLEIRVSQVELSWFANAGTIYQLQYTTNLVSWNSLGNPIVGTGATYSTTDNVPVTSPRRFYRVSASQ